MRSTSASNALAADVTVHYGALLDGAGAGIAGRLDALEAQRDQAATGTTSDY